MSVITFNDFDEYGEAIQHADVSVKLKSNQEMRWQLEHLDLGHIQVQFGAEGSGTITEGSADPAGIVLFGVGPGVMAHANGAVIDPDSIFVMEPGHEFCITGNSSNSWYSMFVSNELLDNMGCVAKKHCYSIQGDAKHVSDLRNLLLKFRNLSAALPSLPESPASATFCNDAISLVKSILCCDPFDSQTGRRTISREQIINVSLEYIEQNTGRIIRVSELADAADVSERTIRTAFRDWFGMSPNRYLQVRQLHDVRRIFVNSHPDDNSVTEILSQQGIWEFGRFANRYQELFGESPSDALRRA